MAAPFCGTCSATSRVVCWAPVASPLPPPHRSPRCWWWLCCSLLFYGCPTARSCCSTPSWPGLSWTPGSFSSAAPVSIQTVPSIPSSIASCLRSSGWPSGSCAGVGQKGLRGGQPASVPPATMWSKRPLRRCRPAGAMSLALRQLHLYPSRRSHISARSEGCPAPPCLSVSTLSVCLLLDSALSTVAGRARRGADITFANDS